MEKDWHNFTENKINEIKVQLATVIQHMEGDKELTDQFRKHIKEDLDEIKRDCKSHSTTLQEHSQRLKALENHAGIEKWVFGIVGGVFITGIAMALWELIRKPIK